MTASGKKVRAVIIGAGVAGTTCAEELASNEDSVQVTLIDPAKGVKLARGTEQETRAAQEVTITEDDAVTWCATRGVRYERARATGLSRKMVQLSDGRELEFDTACIATGARPYVPEALRDERFREHVLTLRDTDSVERLRVRLKWARRVVVVGAGGIAMELVYEIARCEVVWVVKGHVGGAFFDARAADVLTRVFQIGSDAADETGNRSVDTSDMSIATSHVEDDEPSGRDYEAGAAVGPDWLRRRNGAVVFDATGGVVENERCGEGMQGNAKGGMRQVSAEVESLERDGTGSWAVIANLTNGTKIGCDGIIVGTGVRANVEWLAGSGVAVADGVIVEAGKMETSVPGVFAAGDCTRVEHGGANWVQLRVWGQARAAGAAAARCMARHVGCGDGYHGLDFDTSGHVTSLFGRPVVLLGRYDARGLADGFRVYERVAQDAFVRVIVDMSGGVRGAVLVGDVSYAEAYEHLIVTGLNVSFLADRIVDPQLELDEFFD